MCWQDGKVMDGQHSSVEAFSLTVCYTVICQSPRHWPGQVSCSCAIGKFHFQMSNDIVRTSDKATHCEKETNMAAIPG